MRSSSLYLLYLCFFEDLKGIAPLGSGLDEEEPPLDEEPPPDDEDVRKSSRWHPRRQGR